jgi:hypothetical protein
MYRQLRKKMLGKQVDEKVEIPFFKSGWQYRSVPRVCVDGDHLKTLRMIVQPQMNASTPIQARHDQFHQHTSKRPLSYFFYLN